MARGFRLVLPPVRGAGAQLAVAFLVGSVLTVLFKKVLAPFVVLIPEAVLHGFVWQPLSYCFVETSPTGVIFGAIILWSIGGALESDWGRRRFFLFAIGTPAVAGVLTVLLSLLVEPLRAYVFVGGTAMTSACWVAYGLRVGPSQTNFWGLPVTGNVLALIGVGFVFLEGAFSSFILVLPAAFALALTFAYVQWRFPTALFERLGSWRLRRQLNKRTRQLKVVSGGQRNMPGDSDKYLH